MKIFLLMLIIFSCTAFVEIFPQNISPDKNFCGTWLINEYYNRIINSDSVYSALDDSDFKIRLIYISDKPDTLNVSSMNEGNNEKFSPIGFNQLHVTKSPMNMNPYTLSLIKKRGNTLLALNELVKNDKDTVFYVSLGEKYNTANGFHKFINDRIICGIYISENSQSKITFEGNGQLNGFGDFNTYVIDPYFSSYVHHDLIYFQKLQRGKIVNHSAFNWRKVGKDIWLYNLSDDTPKAKVTSLFTILKRTN